MVVLRRLSIGWLIVIALALSGCDPGSDTSADSGSRPAASLTFPLATAVKLTAAVTREQADRAGRAFAWLAGRTNVEVRAVVLPGGPQERRLALLELSAAGTVPDLISEQVAGLAPHDQAQLLTNILTLGDHTPNFKFLMETEASFRSGTQGRMAAPDQLYWLGRFDQTSSPYLGGLAYRQDLFTSMGLRTDTWELLLDALIQVQERFPRTHPLAVSGEALVLRAPSWFRSGLDPLTAAYFHPDDRQWRFGPAEREYEDYLRWFARVYAEGLLASESVGPEATGSTDLELVAGLLSGSTHVISWSGRTGPQLAFPEGYGRLTDAGDWDGTGVWVGSLRLPAGRGGRGWVAPRAWSSVGPGWGVSSASPNTATAVAFLDLLLDDELSEDLLATDDTLIPPVSLRVPGTPSALTPAHGYFLRHDVPTYLQDGAVILDAWPPVTLQARSFIASLAPPIVAAVTPEVMRFITGQRSFGELADFRAQLEAQGVRDLLNWLGAGIRERP